MSGFVVICLVLAFLQSILNCSKLPFIIIFSSFAFLVKRKDNDGLFGASSV